MAEGRCRIIVELTDGEVAYTRSLLRMNARKLRRGITKLTPYPGQPAEEFEQFVEHQAARLAFTEQLHDKLSRDGQHTIGGA